MDKNVAQLVREILDLERQAWRKQKSENVFKSVIHRSLVVGLLVNSSAECLFRRSPTQILRTLDRPSHVELLYNVDNFPHAAATMC